MTSVVRLEYFHELLAHSPFSYMAERLLVSVTI